jgi:colanic acid biosynthesis glycosyl transferase WcaI
MKLLLLTDSYPPEVRSASQIMSEFAIELKNRGHEITILTTMPRYNIADNEKKQSYKECVLEDGIKVIRIKTLPIHKTGAIVRGVANLLLPYSFFKAARRHVTSKIDVIAVYSPPLTLGLAGKWLKRRFKAKLVVNIQDIFPQQAIDLGLMKQKFLITFFERIEKKVYEAADFLTVHSSGNLRYLIDKKRVKPEKLGVVHNWVDTVPFENAASSGRFKKKYGIENRFILLYAGIIGLPQGLDRVLDVASRLIPDKEIVFLMNGDGLERKALEERCKENGIDNVIFQDFVSLKDYPELVKECDIGIVSLSAKNKTPVVPGKLLGYMAAGIPVAAILNRESDGHEMIREAGCGLSVSPDEAGALVDFIRKAKEDAAYRKSMGENGKKYLLANFTRKHSLDKYELIFSANGGNVNG